MAVEYRCGRCGGADVMAEAWAEWDLERQQWRVAETFEFAICHACVRETRLVAHAVTADKAN